MTMRLGTAEIIDPAESERRFPYQLGSIWLGAGLDQAIPLGYEDDRHVCLVAGARAGKGTTTIINNLCLWPGSAIVIDPKGENAAVTAARRGPGSPNVDGMGQAVRVLDPFGEAKNIPDELRATFNPLDALDPNDEQTVDEVSRLVAAIVIPNPEAANPFFDDSARSMVKGVILHVLTDPIYEGRRNLLMVRYLIMRGAWDEIEAARDMGKKNLPTAQALLWSNIACNPAMNGVIASIGDELSELYDHSAETFENVRATAARHTEFLESPALARLLATTTPGFSLSNLKTSARGESIYLVLPDRYMATHFRWLRMMIVLTLTEMERVNIQPASGHMVLMLLDEFAALQRMEAIEHAAAQIAGFKVKMTFVVQSLSQLKAVYKDNWETVFGLSGLKLFFGLEDQFTRKYVSDLIGDTEVSRKTETSSTANMRGTSTTQSTTRTSTDGTSTTDSVGGSHATGFTFGESATAGTSRTSGTGRQYGRGENRQTSSGRSGGESYGTGSTNSSSRSRAWKPGLFNLWTSWDATRNETWGGSSSFNHGVQSGWQRGESLGSQWSESRSNTNSRTDSASQATSHSQTTTDSSTYSRATGRSHSESEAQSHGTGTSESETKSHGYNEGLHKRALITPDELGRVFARRRRGEGGYPGVGLALISGEQPLVFRRVVYHEAPSFMGYFEAHPLYASDFKPSHLIRVTVAFLQERWDEVESRPDWKRGRHRLDFEVQSGDLVLSGQRIGIIEPGRVPVLAPCDGRVVEAISCESGHVPSGGEVFRMRALKESRQGRFLGGVLGAGNDTSDDAAKSIGEAAGPKKEEPRRELPGARLVAEVPWSGLWHVFGPPLGWLALAGLVASLAAYGLAKVTEISFGNALWWLLAIVAFVFFAAMAHESGVLPEAHDHPLANALIWAGIASALGNGLVYLIIAAIEDMPIWGQIVLLSAASVGGLVLIWVTRKDDA